jgi:hypothetical protein
VIIQGFAYGFTSDFTLRVGDAYEWINSNSMDSSGANPITNPHGVFSMKANSASIGT